MHVCYLFWPSPGFKRRKKKKKKKKSQFWVLNRVNINFCVRRTPVRDVTERFTWSSGSILLLRLDRRYTLLLYSLVYIGVVRLLLAKYYFVRLSAEAAISAVPILSRLVFKTADAAWWRCQLHFSVHMGVESVVARALSNDHKIKTIYQQNPRFFKVCQI